MKGFDDERFRVVSAMRGRPLYIADVSDLLVGYRLVIPAWELHADGRIVPIRFDRPTMLRIAAMMVDGGETVESVRQLLKSNGWPKDGVADAIVGTREDAKRNGFGKRRNRAELAWIQIYKSLDENERALVDMVG